VVHVPYRGNAPALSDLLGGQVEFMFASAPSTIEYVKTGKLRALAVTTTKRSETLADVPTVAEFLPGFEASSWYGIGAPKNTPAEIVEKLNREVNAGLADAAMKARLVGLGGIAIAGSPVRASMGLGFYVFLGERIHHAREISARCLNYGAPREREREQRDSLNR
jgi:Tripartite tricarboxylate transporter family receptor